MANDRVRDLTGRIDSDYAWLKSHVPERDILETRSELVTKVRASLLHRIENGRLPYTLGVFGGWGSGKTTFLAMLACELEQIPQCRVVYFNSWKFAGFMEIVPALIYRILQYGSPAPESERGDAMRRVLLALGKKYSDAVGEWAADKIGVDPVDLFKDLYDLPAATAQINERVRAEVVKAYYTQVDKAQDELRHVLGTVTLGQRPSNVSVVLIDELDRCDPDEAFNVIKQMRVLFGMRDLPIAFVVCANPEPIGLSIKHRYGLESDTGDYEARRILEKFVDSYEDLSSAESLAKLVKTMWGRERAPWIVAIDRDNVTPPIHEDTVGNATAFDAITTAVPLFRNIRVLQKSWDYVRDTSHVNRDLIWTQWLLEIARQIDPQFRRELRQLTDPIKAISLAAYVSLGQIGYTVSGDGPRPRVEYGEGKGNTLFAIFRSLFWEHAKQELTRRKSSQEPEDIPRANRLTALLADPLKVDYLILCCLLPLQRMPTFAHLCRTQSGMLPNPEPGLQTLIHSFGYELANG